MCVMKCLLSFFALSLNLVYSWDIAITTGDQIEFYTNQTKISNEGDRFRDLTALAYDAVQNMLLFVDKQNDNASIFSFNLLTKKYLPLVARRSYENIQGLAYDPVTSSMFWTDTNERSIYWIPLPPKSSDNIYGNLLLKLNHEIPRDIAVDSCRGYIYWSNTNVSKPTIERARFDGSDRSIVIDTDIYMPVSLAIDQRTKTLYWVDDKEGIHYSIESSDLEGKNRKRLLAGTQHTPNSLTVSKDSIYWVDWGYKSIWKLPKGSPPNTQPTDIISFFSEVPFGIAANYGILDQVTGVSECKKLLKLASNTNTINETITFPKSVGLFCLHGNKTGVSACKCSAGYVGDRCEISVCQNFCLHGNCSVSAEGTPSCRCQKGYNGARCEINICDRHCLNNGECSVNKDNQPDCKCVNGFVGKRCEIPKTSISPTTQKELCNCTNEISKTSHLSSAVNVSGIINPSSTSSAESQTNDVVSLDTGSCNGEWDPVRDPILMVLGILCGLLCLICAVLITKILNLRKRPRIKRRIIVNKNVTPLTARPDQCEITIENCCNMNICETPCFEPRNSIMPSLLNSKSGKEEKKNLIANMENPDDF